MSIKQYALLGVATVVILAGVVVTTNAPVESDTVAAKPVKVVPLDRQLETVKADNKSAETKLKQETERLKQLEAERLKLESELRWSTNSQQQQ